MDGHNESELRPERPVLRSRIGTTFRSPLRQGLEAVPLPPADLSYTQRPADPEVTAFVMGAEHLRASLLASEEIIDVTDATIAAQAAEGLEEEIDSVLDFTDSEMASVATQTQSQNGTVTELRAHQSEHPGASVIPLFPETHVEADEDNELLDELFEDYQEEFGQSNNNNADDDTETPKDPDAEPLAVEWPQPSVRPATTIREDLAPKRRPSKLRQLLSKRDYMYRRGYYEESGSSVSAWEVVRGKAEFIGTTTEYREGLKKDKTINEPILVVNGINRNIAMRTINKARETVSGLRASKQERVRNPSTLRRKAVVIAVGAIAAVSAVGLISADTPSSVETTIAATESVSNTTVARGTTQTTTPSAAGEAQVSAPGVPGAISFTIEQYEAMQTPQFANLTATMDTVWENPNITDEERKNIVNLAWMLEQQVNS